MENMPTVIELQSTLEKTSFMIAVSLQLEHFLQDVSRIYLLSINLIFISNEKFLMNTK